MSGLAAFSLKATIITDAFFVNGNVSFIWLLYPPFAFFYGLRLMAAYASFLNNLEVNILALHTNEMISRCHLAIFRWNLL